MKVLQVECVVPDLIVGGPSVGILPNLELDDDDGRASNNDSINPTTQSWNYKFEEYPALHTIQRYTQHLDFLNPSVALRGRYFELAAFRDPPENARG